MKESMTSTKKKAKKKRKKSRGKAKGSSFERTICKELTTAFAQFGIKTQDAYRSILSGGHKDSFGDISMSSALCKMFPWAIECKWWKNCNVHDLYLPWKKMSKTKARFGGWWLQTIQGAAKCKRAPCCVFKANKAVVLCAVLLGDLKPLQQKKLREQPYTLTLGPRKKKGSLHRILVIPWHKFLSSCIDVELQKKKHWDPKRGRR